MNETKAKILVVDDDLRLRQLLERYLSDQGFTVKAVPDAQGMDRALERELYDLIVLDLMLPGEDGLAICRRLRGATNPVAIIMLTAKGDEVDRIVGLEIGADDYLPKPFAARELMARMKSVLRRTRMLPPGQAPARLRYAHFGDWTLDAAQRHLVFRDGTLTPLNGAEYALLLFLLEHAQQVVTRDQLLVQLVGREADVFDRSIDLRVSRLRRRLCDDAREPFIVKTVRHEGYVLAQPVCWSAGGKQP